MHHRAQFPWDRTREREVDALYISRHQRECVRPELRSLFSESTTPVHLAKKSIDLHQRRVEDFGQAALPQDSHEKELQGAIVSMGKAEPTIKVDLIGSTNVDHAEIVTIERELPVCVHTRRHTPSLPHSTLGHGERPSPLVGSDPLPFE